MGAIAGSNLYIAREAPKYPTGFGACLGFTGAGALVTCFLRYAYGKENKRRDEFERDMGGKAGVQSRYSEQELLDMGDRSPFFRYAL
jgi:hypothetical protein